MKRLLTLAAAALAFSAQAQVSNPSFENPGYPIVMDGAGSVPGWFHSAGNPLVSNEAGGYDSEHAAKLASSDISANAIVGSTNFTPGNTYNVSFWVRTPECQRGNLSVWAANGMKPGSTGVGQSQLITTYNASTGGAWKQVTTTFTPEICMNQIHFFLDGRECPAIMYIDEVDVECLPGTNIVPNHDFENNTGGSFGNGDVANWDASHYTPSLFGGTGNNWAWMWSYSGDGEGIFASAAIQAGITYEVSYRVRTNTPPNPANFFIIAASGLTPNTAWGPPPSPSPSQVIDTDAMGATYNSWTTVTTTFTATNNFTQILIYPLMNGAATGGVQAELEIDDIVIRRACQRPCLLEETIDPVEVKFRDATRSLEPANVDALGLSDERVAPIQAYPNPASDVVKMEILRPTMEGGVVRILTLQGKEVDQIRLEKGQTNVEWQVPAGLQGGMYIMRMDGDNASTPLMIQK